MDFDLDKPLSAEDKQNKMIKLFASIEILSNSKLCVGTFTTNPGLFLGMKMEEKSFHSVQKKSWFKFELDEELVNNYNVVNRY